MTSVPYEFRYARITRLRWILSGGPVIALGGLATNYLIAGASQTQASQVVAYLDDTLFFWPGGFSVVFLLLVGSLILVRGLPQTHVLAAAMFTGYSVALVAGAVSADKPTWAAASLSLGMAFYSLMMALTYAKAR